jgi:PHD/YefM family antitoxin component YafN of YafNO toxin-antitoxin module
MKIVRQAAAFAAVSELRTHMDEILKQLKETPVTLERHNKEIAVLEDPKRFAAMQEALEAANEVLLAFEARERETHGGKFVPLKDVEKRFL